METTMKKASCVEAHRETMEKVRKVSADERRRIELLTAARVIAMLMEDAESKAEKA